MVRDSSEISWALATGEADTDIAEAEDMIARKAAMVFKLKGGAKPPQADVERAVKVSKALAGRAEVRIDLNQVWDETTANRWIPALIAGGISLREQPQSKELRVGKEFVSRLKSRWWRDHKKK